MPTVRASHPGGDPATATCLLPRDDALVVEHEQSPGRFVAVEGPFADWVRTVETADDGHVRETIRYRTAVAHWGWVVDQLVRRPVRNGTSGRRWWTPPDRLSPHDVTVLGISATLALLAGFLGGLVTQTITFVAKDFGVGTWRQSVALALVRVGALLTLVAMAWADRLGRRTLVHRCLVVASVAAIATAAAPDIWTFAAAQMVCRGLVAAAALLLPVVAAEELPAGSRAYATGILALSAGLGVGMVLWVLPLVDLAPWAWRLVFLLGLPAIAVTTVAIRRLPETRRFMHDDVEEGARAHQHIRRNRFMILGAAVFLLNVFAGPVGQLQNEYLRSARHFSGTQVAVFLLLTNTWGGIGVVAGSQLSDRRSRRLAAGVGLVGYSLGNAVMFAVGGIPMWIASVAGSIVGAAIVPSVGAMLPELFPTLRRGAANGWLNLAGVLGSVAGLLTAGALVDGTGYRTTFGLLSIAPLVVVVLLRWVPESAGVELESLNPDD